MPVTPRFKVSQSDEAVIVCIKVPHVRVGNAETHVDGREFSFYCKPYLLRLALPHELSDDDERCKAVYDAADDHGTVTVTLPKAVRGQDFPDLDLTTTLLQPRWTPKDLIKEREEDSRVVVDSGIEVVGTEHYVNIPEEDEIREHLERSTAAAGGSRGSSPAGGVHNGGRNEGRRAQSHLDEPEVLLRPPRYGFNDKFSGFFAALRDELQDMIQLPDPDRTPASARRGLRIEHEEAEFDVDRYLGDLFPEEEDPILTEALGFNPHWRRRPPAAPSSSRRIASSAGGSVGSDLSIPVQAACSALTSPMASSQASADGSGVRPSNARAIPCLNGEVERAPGASGSVGPPDAATVAAETVDAPEGSDKSADRIAREAGSGTTVGSAAGGGEGPLGREHGMRDELVRDGPKSSGGVTAATARADAKKVGQEVMGADEGAFGGFTEAEQEQMRRLPNREYLIQAGSKEERRALLGLADLLFAYAYDHRTTAGEPTVESSWTLAVLSPLLSWLETPEADAREVSVALAGIRRSLIFPYLRVWELGVMVARDVGHILEAGKRCVLRCLLQVYAILERGEVHYLLNKLFVEDYCVWIQKVSGASLAAFAQAYKKSTRALMKSGVGLNLEGLEAEAVGETSGENRKAGSSACLERGESSEDESSSEESSEDEESDSEEDATDEGSGRDELSGQRCELEGQEQSISNTVAENGCSSTFGLKVGASESPKMSHHAANETSAESREEMVVRGGFEGAARMRPENQRSSALLRLEPHLARSNGSCEGGDGFPIGSRLALLDLSGQTVPGGSTAGNSERRDRGSLDGVDCSRGSSDVAVPRETKRLVEEM